MNEAHSPLSSIGGFLQIGALAAAVWIGFEEVPAMSGSLLGCAIIQVVYVLVRLPQMARVWAIDRIKVVKLALLQLAANFVIATVFYWLGRGIARHF